MNVKFNKKKKEQTRYKLELLKLQKKKTMRITREKNQ